MKKFNGFNKGFIGVATVASVLVAAGMVGVPQLLPRLRSQRSQ